VALQSLNAFDEEDDQSSIEDEKPLQAKTVQFIHQTAREYLRKGNLPPDLNINPVCESSDITFKGLVMETSSAGYALPGQVFLLQAITFYQKIAQKYLPRILGDHFFQYALDLDEMITGGREYGFLLRYFFSELSDFMRSSSFKRSFRDLFQHYGSRGNALYTSWINRDTPEGKMFAGIAANLHNANYLIPNDFTVVDSGRSPNLLDFAVFGPRLTESRLDRVRAVKTLLEIDYRTEERSPLTSKLPKTGVEALYEEGFENIEALYVNTLQALIICSDNVSGMSERTRLEIAELLLKDGAKVDGAKVDGAKGDGATYIGVVENGINFKGWKFTHHNISKFCLSFRSPEWVALLLKYGHTLPIDTSVHKLLLEKDTLITCSQYWKLWERLEELGESSCV
jgi:hypothetical protein